MMTFHLDLGRMIGGAGHLCPTLPAIALAIISKMLVLRRGGRVSNPKHIKIAWLC
jgi:hypothetical protein